MQCRRLSPRVTWTPRSLTVLALAGAILAPLPARADPPAAAGSYTLDATVSPPPLTAAECAVDPRCVLASPPLGGGADDQPALKAAIDAAKAMTVPAVMSGTEVVTAARTATVLLAAGSYSLKKPLLLPPNVDLRGRGIATTNLILDPAGRANFRYSFIVRPEFTNSGTTTSPGSTNLVADLSVNGSCRAGRGLPTSTESAPENACDAGALENEGGGIKAGDRWTIRQVRFTNLRYFKLWIHGTRGVQAIDNRFDNWGGAFSGGNDNIGGGGYHDGTVIAYNQFDETLVGNSIDFVHTVNATIRHNTVLSRRQYLSRLNVPDYGSVFLEGATNSVIESNLLHGAHLVLQSNAGYDHSGSNLDILNVRNVVVRDNHIVDSFADGITLRYDDYTAPPAHQMWPGGNNTIRGNTVVRPTLSGIRIFGTPQQAKNAPDAVIGNTIVDAGALGSVTTGVGCATMDTSGIGLGLGNGDSIYGNIIVDDQANATTWYGIHLGARGCAFQPTNTILTDPSSGPNTAQGIVGTLLRYGSKAPQPPTLLEASREGSGVTLKWKEAVPLAATPIAGYRIYRDGLLTATLPVGSTTIPSNLLSQDESSFEGGIAGYTAPSSVTLSLRATVGAVGAASLGIASGAAGAYAYGPAVAVSAGAPYSSVASFSSAANTRRVRVGIRWLTAQRTTIATHATSNTGTSAAPTRWVTSWYTTQAPLGAAFAQPFVAVDGTTPSELYYVDRVGLVGGDLTETWSDPSPPLGTVRYHVAAYSWDGNENSVPVLVIVP